MVGNVAQNPLLGELPLPFLQCFLRYRSRIISDLQLKVMSYLSPPRRWLSNQILISKFRYKSAIVLKNNKNTNVRYMLHFDTFNDHSIDLSMTYWHSPELWMPWCYSWSILFSSLPTDVYCGCELLKWTLWANQSSRQLRNPSW